MANYISLESLTNVDFGKNVNCRVFNSTEKKIAKMTAKMTMRHSTKQMNYVIGYQNSADFCEIWPAHSLDVVKQNFVGDF